MPLKQDASSDPESHLPRQVVALLRDMRSQGTGRKQPVREIAAMLGDRWTTLIILILETGTWRHAELRRVVGQLSDEGGISQRVLTLKLRALERNGLVGRVATAEVPPRVNYSLTPLGSSLAGEARRLIGWVVAHRAAIDAARAAFQPR